MGHPPGEMPHRLQALGLPQLLLQLAALGGVVEVDGEALLGGIGLDIRPQVEGFVVGLEGDGLLGPDRLTVALLEHRAHRLGQHIEDALAQHLIAAYSDDALRLAIEVGKPPVLVEGEKAVGDAFEGGVEAFGQGLECHTPAAFVVDVDGGAKPLEGFALAVPGQGGAEQVPAVFAVVAAQAQLHAERLAGIDRMAPGGLGGGPVVRVGKARALLAGGLLIPGHAGVVEHLLAGKIHPTIRLRGPHDHGHGFRQLAEALFKPGEGRLRLFQGADVLHGAVDTHHIPGGIPIGAAYDPKPAGALRGMQEAKLIIEGLPLGCAPGQAVINPGAILGKKVFLHIGGVEVIRQRQSVEIRGNGRPPGPATRQVQGPASNPTQVAGEGKQGGVVREVVPGRPQVLIDLFEAFAAAQHPHPEGGAHQGTEHGQQAVHQHVKDSEARGLGRRNEESDRGERNARAGHGQHDSEPPGGNRDHHQGGVKDAVGKTQGREGVGGQDGQGHQPQQGDIKSTGETERNGIAAQHHVRSSSGRGQG